MFPTEGHPSVSSLFSARRSPLARLHGAYRRHRAAPHRGLTRPLLLAIGIAAAGHQVAAAARPVDARTASVALNSAASTNSSATVMLSDRTALRLGEPAVQPRHYWGAAPAGATLVRPPARASRSVVRRPVVKAKPKLVVAKARWVRPSGGPLTSPYGRRWGRMHEGLDFGAGYGSPVRAAFDGVVVFASWDSGYGKQIRIRHSGGIVTTYSHLSRFVVTGGRVSAGDVIGKIGSTGNSTGPHLHFEVLVGGTNVNPRPFLAKRGVRS